MTFPKSISDDLWQHPPRQWIAQMIGAVTFYTRIPIPVSWPMSFAGIARYAPLVGVSVIGLMLVGVDLILNWIAMPIATRSGLMVALWLLITGGLHLDGAMDTADGLAVSEDRRLEVMADSQSGAFGVMVAIVILSLKGICLTDLDILRGFTLLATTGWSRWGQVVAIARYPYLKKKGKGAFHKEHARPKTDWLVGFIPLLCLSGTAVFLHSGCWSFIIGTTLSGILIGLLTGWWLNSQMGGQTGDTYGAIVEWTEVLTLCIAVGLSAMCK